MELPLFKIYSIITFVTITLLLIDFPQKTSAPKNCRSNIPQSALVMARAFNDQLISLSNNADYYDENIKDSAKIPLALMKTSIDQLITSEVMCLPSEDFDKIKFYGVIQKDFARITNHIVKSHDDWTYGLKKIDTWFYPKQNLLIVRSSFGTPCSDDTQFSGYRLFEGTWQKVIGVSSDVLGNPTGEFQALDFRDPVFVKDQATGQEDILLISNPGHCSSNWSGFAAIVVNPADEYGLQKDIFSYTDVYFDGGDSTDPQVEIKDNKFQFNYRGNTDLKLGGPSSIRKTAIFELNNGVVKRIKHFN